MTTCDHGIRLDRYCGDCEIAFDVWEEQLRTDRRRSGLIALVAFALLAGLVLAAWWTR